MYYISIIKNEKQSNKYLFTYHPEQKIKHYQNSWSPTCTTPKHSFLSLHNPYPTLEVYHFRALTFFDNVYILEQYRQLFVMFLNKWYHTCTFPWASNWGEKNKHTKCLEQTNKRYSGWLQSNIFVGLERENSY